MPGDVASCVQQEEQHSGYDMQGKAGVPSAVQDSSFCVEEPACS